MGFIRMNRGREISALSILRGDSETALTEENLLAP